MNVRRGPDGTPKARAVLRRGREGRLRAGHPWIYAGEIDEIHGSFQPGDIVDVVDGRGRFLARGYINPASQILIRVLSFAEEDLDEDFWRKRLKSAIDYRKVVARDASSLRLVFGEADFLPALVVDKYEDVLVIQTLSLGMEVRKHFIVDILTDLTGLNKVFERNDVPSREHEGLSQTKGFVRGEFDTSLIIRENGLSFKIDVENGQKTGYFLDQRENRAAIAPYVEGARVLDAFCHIGSFSCHAAKYGAREVTGIDISEDAVAIARANAALNGFEDVLCFRVANAFDELRALERAGEKYDVVILDPPAFTKTRKALEGAVRGYKEINIRGAKLVREGGFLITCSCSHHMDEDLFEATVFDAVSDAGRTARVVEVRSQAKDHPVLMGVKETKYLKCFILQVL